MSAGTYATTDPNIRIKVEHDNDFHDDPHYSPGVREDLIAAYESGDVYGVIKLEREKWARITEDQDGNVTLHECEERWEATDSILSCVGYDIVAAEVALEHFNVTVTEKI